MGYTRSTFETQGYTFKLRPTSPANVQDLMEYLQEGDIEEEVEDQDDVTLAPLANQYHDVLFLISEPVGEDEAEVKEAIDPMHLDLNQIDYYMRDFMPMQSGTENQQS